MRWPRAICFRRMLLVRYDIRHLPFGQIRPLAIIVCRFNESRRQEEFFFNHFLAHKYNDLKKISSYTCIKIPNATLSQIIYLLEIEKRDIEYQDHVNEIRYNFEEIE